MKLTKSQTNALKSYLKAVGVSTVTLVLALVADVKPELAIVAAALIAPLVKWLDPQDEQVG